MRPNRRSHPSATPLAHTQLVVSITDLVAEYTIQQHFENTGTRAIEVVYSIPVPLDAAFLAMRAALGGETVEAVIQPKAHAEQTYNAAVADGDSAALLSSPEAGVLFIALGNLLPGESGSLELRFVSSLGVADQMARFNLPLVHRPRFGHWRLEELEMPTHDFCVHHPMSATIRVAGLLATTAVSSNFHDVRFQSRADAIELEINDALLDRDLALEFDLDAPLAPTGHLIADGDANLAVATFVLPSATSPPQALDLYLLLDCSGSMSGDAILQSRQATSAVMQALDADDRIQILRFGSEVVPMFRRKLRATPSARQTVSSLLPRIQADLGGTEMNDALQRAVAELATEIGMWPENTRSRVIILVTDGAVQAEDIASAQAAALKAGIRIFVVAVGSSAATEVLQPLAETTGGVMERAVPAEPIHDGVMRQVRRARMAAPITLQVNTRNRSACAWPTRAMPPASRRACR